ncbi:MAG: FAD binding domain-containing protein [Actinobacteria bacterium]|nr:FAD binding domain-containing protein [Actinomycetota bacterium]
MSLTNIETFVRPETVEEAFAALGEHARPISGGTDVMLRNPTAATTLVDLMGLPLGEITESPGGGFTVGANATLTAMADHPGLAGHLGGILPEMLVHVGSPLLRNQCTLGGHLARGRLSDVVPVLVALDAEITWFDGEHHAAPIARFYEDGTHRGRLIVTGVEIPAATGTSAGAFHKFLRTFFDLALLNAACVLWASGDGTLDAARVVVGETPSLGVRVTAAEDALAGVAPGPEAFAAAGAIARAEVETRADSRASAEYRSQLVGVAVERCLAKAAARLEVSS